jgi:hypothetical protein
MLDGIVAVHARERRRSGARHVVRIGVGVEGTTRHTPTCSHDMLAGSAPEWANISDLVRVLARR